MKPTEEQPASGTISVVSRGPNWWSYQVRFHPEETRKTILAAYREKDGNAVHAAEHLEIPHVTLMRYVKRLGLAADIDLIRGKKESPAEQKPTKKAKAGKGAK